ncbi:MAG: HPF/RaiA family ribosome-associated protein [Hyphomicrobiaceae bacterium]|nr:HPF/RaiA family ribosome-associated protein [Hyphomicrobiaceae bacterium]
MPTQTEVHFHGIEKSAAVEARILEKVEKLGRHFERLSRARVVVEAPHRNALRPLAYLIKIELSIPGRKPIVVSHERAVSQGNDELQLAIRDAFETAARKLEDLSRKLSERSRTERARRRPARSDTGSAASD